MKFFIIFEANRICDDVIMDIAPVNVSCNNILKFSSENFISKFNSNLVSRFIIYLARRKRLYQMKSKVAVYFVNFFFRSYKLLISSFGNTTWNHFNL